MIVGKQQGTDEGGEEDHRGGDDDDRVTLTSSSVHGRPASTYAESAAGLADSSGGQIFEQVFPGLTVAAATAVLASSSKCGR